MLSPAARPDGRPARAQPCPASSPWSRPSWRSEVCSAYALRAGEILELRATHGLNPASVGRTRLRVGEGIVGLVAATGQPLNLADAQNHPAFAYRAGDRRGRLRLHAGRAGAPRRPHAGRAGGAEPQPRHYTDIETELLETVAMLLTDLLAAWRQRHARGFRRQPAAPVRRGPALARHRVRPRAAARHRLAPSRLLADDPAAELAACTRAGAMRQGLDSLIETQLPALARRGAGAARHTGRHAPGAAGDGWLKRVTEAVAAA